jgi:RAMP superfamily
MPFHNPYHFVPVINGNRVEDLDKSEFVAGNSPSHSHVTHDRYQPGGGDTPKYYSGCVVCRIKAETAFVVGGNQEKGRTDADPTVVEQFCIGDYPAIPATTIRGMLSSLFEAATNSAMRVLDDRVFSYRKEAKYPLKRLGMVINNPATGTLAMIRLCTFAYDPRIGAVVSPHARMVVLPPGNALRTFTLAANEFLYYWDGVGRPPGNVVITESEYRRLAPAQQRDYQIGILRVMENAARSADFALLGRKHEIFIFWDPNPREQGPFQVSTNRLPISPNAIERFHRLADLQTALSIDLPYEPVGTVRNIDPKDDRMRIKPGDIVYYGTTGTGTTETVTEISFSAIWRDQIGGMSGPDTTHDFFRSVDPELLPFNTKRTHVTIAEQLFGFVEKNPKLKEGETRPDELSLAGRIRPSDALLSGFPNGDGALTLPEDPEDCYDFNTGNPGDGYTLLKALSNPKPPSPALYFKGNGGTGYVAKKDLSTSTAVPQGRKFYLHHKTNGARPWETRSNDRPGLKMKVKPVKRGAVLHFHIDFDNLSENEFNALIYTLCPTDKFQHKVGLGKPIGLGSIRIDPVGIYLVDRIKRYSASEWFGPRYSEAWADPKLCSSLPSSYSSEADAEVTLENSFWTGKRDAFRAMMPTSLLDAVETLGDSENVTLQVHYPSVAGENAEQEHFQWFVANDQGTGTRQNKLDAKRQPLTAVSLNNIPTLDEHEWRG